MISTFEEAYNKLNSEQKKAVDTLDGPVMVVAGPGTGKTQVLSLRIANILKTTDTPPSGILCLTFTRSGVKAMKNRLHGYIGSVSSDIEITTFHSFCFKLVEKYYPLLGFTYLPKLLEDYDSILLFDEILTDYEWEYIRPRTNPSQYFSDMTHVISLLKREGVSPESFLEIAENEIQKLVSSPESISSRGVRKGELKREVEEKIQGLQKTKEVVRFYELYESLKKERHLLDYDDVLTYAVELVTLGQDIRAELYENYLYVLVDEHQDSSAIQNGFLKAVWGEVECPNIFVVGDDRQLIYGFSGAHIDYFTEFKHIFGKAQSITLYENYRSTQNILDLSDSILKSTLASDNLKSNKKNNGSIQLQEYSYPRDEILACGLYFKKKIEQGVNPKDCVLLVPKNYQVRSATEIFKALDIPITSESTLSLFSSVIFQRFKKILLLLCNPYDEIYFSDVLLDPSNGVDPLSAHKFIKNNNKKINQLNIEALLNEGNLPSLFSEENTLYSLGIKMQNALNAISGQKISFAVSYIGNNFFINESADHKSLLESVEVIRTCIHLSLLWEEKQGHKGDLGDFIEYLQRLEVYEHTIPVASFGGDSGVSIMTLHKSKGLEYDHVWIAHMNEEVIMSEKRIGFTLPEEIKEKIHERDIMSVTRELYVALTRAKSDVTFSYANKDYKGSALSCARIIENIPSLWNSKIDSIKTEQDLLAYSPNIFTQIGGIESNTQELEEVKKFVQNKFETMKVSVSLLNNFFECPWKWYFRSFLKVPEVKGTSLALGSVVHSAIEYILGKEKLPTKEELKGFIELSLEKEGIQESQEKKKLASDAYNAISLWTEEYYPYLSKDKKSEQSISYSDKRFPNISLYGKLDLIEKFSDKNLIVTDFKTGSEKTKSIIEKLDEEGRLSSYMRQLAMYTYLIEGSWKEAVGECRLLFLESDKESKNKLYRIHIDQKAIDMLTKDIDDYINMCNDGSWVSRVCYYKSYGKHTPCEYCARASIIFNK